MLTSAAPLVKLAPETTPEQQSCASDIDQALTIFWTLVERLQVAAEEKRPIHQVEEMIFRDLLAIGRAMLRAFLASSGDGDVGPTLRRARQGAVLGKFAGTRPRTPKFEDV